MSTENQQPSAAAEVPAPVAAPAVAPAATPAAATPMVRQQRGGAQRFGNARGGTNRPGQGRPGQGGQRGGGRGRDGRGSSDVPSEADYEEKNLEVARVTRVTKGGKRMRFRTLTVIGNRKGRVGFGVAKGVDVAASTTKAIAQARKALITVPLQNETLPHVVLAKFGASQVLLKPAPKGTGIKAGGAVRSVLELAGIPNVVSKILGSSNKINNVKATFAALKMLRLPTYKRPEAKQDVKPEAAAK